QTLTILPSFFDSQIFSHFVSDRRRSISVDTDLNQSMPIYISRHRSEPVDADLYQSTLILTSRRRFYIIDIDHPAD
ncbi:hypothetical protein KI387_021152, partial [Taxus chinensis]